MKKEKVKLDDFEKRLIIYACSFSDTQNSMRIGLVLFAIGNLSFRKDRGFGRHPNKHFEE